MLPSIDPSLLAPATARPRRWLGCGSCTGTLDGPPIRTDVRGWLKRTESSRRGRGSGRGTGRGGVQLKRRRPGRAICRHKRRDPYGTVSTNKTRLCGRGWKYRPGTSGLSESEAKCAPVLQQADPKLRTAKWRWNAGDGGTLAALGLILATAKIIEERVGSVSTCIVC